VCNKAFRYLSYLNVHKSAHTDKLL